MVYEYSCPQCNNRFDVVKSVQMMDSPESCERCHVSAIRDFVPSRVHFTGTRVEHAEYNPGLGCIVRNKSHRAELCKIKGVEEIGNEKPESLHKHFDQKREEKFEQAWHDVDKAWIGNGDIGG